MKVNSTKRSLLICAGFVAAIIADHIFRDVSWRTAMGETSVAFFAWSIYNEIGALRSEMGTLRSAFLNADAELARVSALASDLQGQILTARWELEKLERTQEMQGR